MGGGVMREPETLRSWKWPGPTTDEVSGVGTQGVLREASPSLTWTIKWLVDPFSETEGLDLSSLVDSSVLSDLGGAPCLGKRGLQETEGSGQK